MVQAGAPKAFQPLKNAMQMSQLLTAKLELGGGLEFEWVRDALGRFWSDVSARAVLTFVSRVRREIRSDSDLDLAVISAATSLEFGLKIESWTHFRCLTTQADCGVALVVQGTADAECFALPPGI